MTLVRWNPAVELASMEVQRLNHMFESLYGGGTARAWVPAVDIFETPLEVVLKAELPDMKREDISVTCEHSVLTIAGERKPDAELPEEAFQRRERQYGAFTRAFTLPPTVDTSRINAGYKDGVLTVRLPRREDVLPRQIAIND